MYGHDVSVTRLALRSIGFGLALLGVVLIVIPAIVARWNDTSGPRWLRRLGKQRDLASTDPRFVRGLGLAFIAQAILILSAVA